MHQTLWQSLSSHSLSSLSNSFSPYRDILFPFLSACYDIKNGVRVASSTARCHGGRSQSLIRNLTYPRLDQSDIGKKEKNERMEWSHSLLKAELIQNLSDVNVIQEVFSLYIFIYLSF